MNGQVLLHRRGAYTRGRAIYDFAKFSPKRHEIKRIWTSGARPSRPLDPPVQWEVNFGASELGI